MVYLYRKGDTRPGHEIRLNYVNFNRSTQNNSLVSSIQVGYRVWLVTYTRVKAVTHDDGMDSNKR